MMQPTFHCRVRRAKFTAPYLLCALLTLAALALAPMAQANGVLNASGGQPILAQSGGISSSDAADAVQQRFGGRVLKVETSREGSGTVYRVKILQDDGRIRTVSVDAQSGRIID